MTTSDRSGSRASGLPTLLAAAALVGFDAGAVGFVLPAMRAATGADSASASALVWVYVLGTLLAIAGTGWATSRWAPIALLRAGLALSLLGAGVAAWAPGASELAIARLLQGLGQGGLLPLAATLVAAQWPPTRVGRINGALAMAYGLAYVGATLAAPVFLSLAGWRAGFMLSLTLAALTWLGATRLPVAAVTPRQPSTPSRRWWRGQMVVVAIIAIGTGIGQAVLVWLPTVAQVRLGVTPVVTAGLLVPMLVGGLLASVVLTAWLDRAGARPMLVGGATLSLAGLAVVALAPPLAPAFAAGSGALGFGVAALCGGPLHLVAAQARPGADQGRAQAAVALAINAGLLVGTLLLGRVSAVMSEGRTGVELALLVAGASMLPCFAALIGLRQR